jgi:hypothetical protein
LRQTQLHSHVHDSTSEHKNEPAPLDETGSPKLAGWKRYMNKQTNLPKSIVIQITFTLQSKSSIILAYSLPQVTQ